MSIWVAGSKDLVGKEGDDEGKYCRGVDIPFPHYAGDGLVQLEKYIVEAHNGEYGEMLCRDVC